MGPRLDAVSTLTTPGPFSRHQCTLLLLLLLLLDLISYLTKDRYPFLAGGKRRLRFDCDSRVTHALQTDPKGPQRSGSNTDKTQPSYPNSTRRSGHDKIRKTVQILMGVNAPVWRSFHCRNIAEGWNSLYRAPLWRRNEARHILYTCPTDAINKTGSTIARKHKDISQKQAVACQRHSSRSSYGSACTVWYGYPHRTDSRNILDNDDAQTFSDSLIHMRPIIPAVQDTAKKPGRPAVEKLLNAASRDWMTNNPDGALTFPLKNAVMSQPDSIYAQLPSHGSASADAGHATHSARPQVNYDPSSSSQAHSPNFGSWQSELSSSGSPVYSNYYPSGANVPHRFYEDTFEYPPDKTGSSQNYNAVSDAAGLHGKVHYVNRGASAGHGATLKEPSFTNAARGPDLANLWRMVGSPGKLNFGHSNYYPGFAVPSWRPLQPVKPQTPEVSSYVSEQIFPPAPPPSYITQSRRGYQRSRYQLSKSKYLPDFYAQMPAGPVDVNSPASSQPADPKGLQNSQRYTLISLSNV
ncbi:uncharacterized protein V6R79_025040 [Siganus canaliculatus]